MDSEDSRDGVGGNASSTSSSSSGSASPAGPRSPPSRRSSRPASPASCKELGSPLNAKSASEKSNRNSPESDSPDKERGRKSYSRSPRGNKSDSGDDSSPERAKSPASPPPGSPRSPDSESSQTAPDKWSTKSDMGSRQPSVSPMGSPKWPPSGRASPEPPRRRERSSSASSRDSSPGERPVKHPPTEEISDGEMESDHEQDKLENHESKEEKIPTREKKNSESNVNMSHEDLSDVSDLESLGAVSEDERRTVKKSPIRAPDHSDSRESPPKYESKLNGNLSKSPPIISPSKISSNGTIPDTPKLEKIPQEKTSKTEDVEEQLDFEAEEGECVEVPEPKQNNIDKNSETNKDEDEGSVASSLEEGEVSDEEERRPEETEPRPVCRFYSRGQCTWGVSCRFLHPGVTDKGNYTMFDMVRAMPPGYAGHPGAHHVPPSHAAPAHAHPGLALALASSRSESAWERGLRTAKEMMRKATKRKEQDTDFEEKKLHLSLAASGRAGSLGPDEEDPELAAYAGYSLPREAIKREREEYYRQAEREEYYRLMERRTAYEEASRPAYMARERPRVPRYSRMEGPPEGSPPPHYYQDKGASDMPPHHKSRRPRTTREVIVQKAAMAPGRGDEWADPWMRSGGRAERRNKYSSASSYSSSSSRSSNSSNKSPSRPTKRGARSPPRQRVPRPALSPSVIVQERRAATVRALAMNPPAPSARRRAPSPAAARQHAANPPPPPKVHRNSLKGGVDAFGRTKPSKPKPRKRYSKSSSSGSDSSSSSSDSDSESGSSSSSSGSVPRRNAPPPERRAPTAAPPISQAMPRQNDTKKDGLDNNIASKKRAAMSPPSAMLPAKRTTSRREELLKQLKAVEDAIARKRSKI